jgi:hypothetical protein
MLVQGIEHKEDKVDMVLVLDEHNYLDRQGKLEE